MSIKKWVSLCVLVVGVLLLSTKVQAGTLKAPEVFRDGTWTYIGETGKFEEAGSIQSICVTRDYIICLENASNTEATNDTLVAFYKNDYNLSGNPVEQYSYALHVNEMDYEHGNGMTYNDKENKVIVASGPVLDPENLGTIYKLDAATLKFEEQLKILDDGRSVLGIDYLSETDQYVILTGFEQTTYQFVLMDSNFQIIDTIMEGNQSEGNYFQDFCVSGDYLVGLPYFVGGRKEQRIQLYSLSERRWIDNYPLIFAEDMSNMEPEGICEVAPGHFMVGTILKNPKRMGLYALQVPVVYSVNTSIENGTISDGSAAVDYGGKFKVEYQPNEGYEVKEILVNGEPVEIKKYISRYTFDDIDKDQTIEVTCVETPKFYIKGTVLNGTIDAETAVFADTPTRVNFAPNEHCRLKGVYIDGQLVEVPLDTQYYDFENIEGDHEIYVEFEQIPECTITIKVTNGYTGELEAVVKEGEAYTANFKPQNNYVLDKILVDGERVLHDENVTTYEIVSVSGNHVIEIIYKWKNEIVILVIFGLIILAVVLFMGSIRFKRARHKKRRKQRG